MRFFGKKAATDLASSTITSVTESLYKQNSELAVRNKTLSLLRQLYQISIQTIEPESLGKKIVDTVRSSLEFELVGIFTINSTDKKLTPLSFAFSDRLREAMSKSGESTNLGVSDIADNEFLLSIFTEKKSRHTEKLDHIWTGVIPKETVAAWTEAAHIKTTAGYPLIINGEIMGLLILSLNREYDSLTKFEQESIASFVDVVAIALDKAYLYQELAASNNRQEGLIHFISHEIKGFLAKNEAAFAGILEGDYGDVSAEAKELSEIALADTRKGVTTVMDILSASNLKKGTIKFDMKPFDLKPAVLDAVKDQLDAAAHKSMALNVHIDDGAFMMSGDEKEIGGHVIRNLIDNAVKYTPKGSIDISLVKQDGKIIFAVKDSGIGITDEDKKHLFTEGGRGKDSIKTNVNSTGYGLFIAKQVIDAHKGRIWAESEGPGKGSTFYVELEMMK
ncbi:MAG: GAF domain-containing sensor histidine kinase [Patescibacteria group bacterium]